MSSVQGINQFDVMNEEVVEEVNLGIDNCVMKRENDFREGNDGLVFKSDELETGVFIAGTAPGLWGEERHWGEELAPSSVGMENSSLTYPFPLAASYGQARLILLPGVPSKVCAAAMAAGELSSESAWALNMLPSQGWRVYADAEKWSFCSVGRGVICPDLKA